MELEKRKKKRNLFIAGIVTVVVVACAVVFGARQPETPTASDPKAEVYVPDFGNTATVAEDDEAQEVPEKKPEAVAKNKAQGSEKKSRTTKHGTGKKSERRAKVGSKKADIDAMEAYKKMTPEQIAALTARSGKKMRAVRVGPSDVVADRAKARAARQQGSNADSPRMKEIHSRLRRRSQRLIKCQNGIEESIPVAITIRATGTISKLSVTSGTDAKKKCISRELRKLVFPPGSSEIVVKKRYVVP